MQAADRALVLLGPASTRDRPLKEQVRTVRGSLTQLQDNMRAALELHLEGRSSTAHQDQDESGPQR